MTNNREIFLKEFKGHSGCKILLYSSDKGYFVRKISKSIEYNNRLKKQLEKQKFFYNNLSTEEISTPKILDSGYINGLFYFDMEYERGFIITEHIFNANLKELENISDVLGKIMYLFKNSPTGEEVSLSEKFEEKINSLKNNLPQRYLPLLQELSRKSKKLPKVKSAFCHGDLTLENIIYDKYTKKIYLIDFQDVFVEHYWWDICLVFQDVDEAWYMFKHTHLDPKIMKIKMDYLRDRIIEFIEEEYLDYHNIFMAMKFLRIVPYANEQTHDYLYWVILKNLNQIS